MKIFLYGRTNNAEFALATLAFFAIATLLLLPMVSVVLASPADRPIQAPRLHVKDTSFSSNWSGYAVESNLNSPASNYIRSASGSWVIPALSCTPTTTYSSIWVGIDGYSSNTVEQLGTEQDCSGGVQRNYAWFEMYPSASRLITTVSVNAGDRITASVVYLGSSQFRLNLRDLTTGQTFSTLASGTAQLSSAEWVVEAPSAASILPLSNFGTATITNARYTTIASPSVTETISGLGSNTYTDIAMHDPAGGNATPTSLNPTGTAFRDTYSS
ncbi:MAG: G1 family glutamic endopeptidase [Nitrososphaera sp.]